MSDRYFKLVGQTNSGDRLVYSAPPAQFLVKCRSPAAQAGQKAVGQADGTMFPMGPTQDGSQVIRGNGSIGAMMVPPATSPQDGPTPVGRQTVGHVANGSNLRDQQCYEATAEDQRSMFGEPAPKVTPATTAFMAGLESQRKTTTETCAKTGPAAKSQCRIQQALLQQMEGQAQFVLGDQTQPTLPARNEHISE